MSGPNAAFDREWDLLEEQLADPEATEADRKEIRRLMREMQREAVEPEVGCTKFYDGERLVGWVEPARISLPQTYIGISI